ncbi:protein of unknown function (plasmid) [Cupriavidus taiwanensis]|uniref:Uncharacterized protein n=1 Tax=Cupriavidus taiwanensis TaxID=164546 RepID=A0A375FL07_9BURK|nr:hypothetical protein [Cupriavidus taiwanensis]SOZ70903.1 protein of unknown function [Cupriavidus taiwanensis]SOZ72088.1 protein of unknown function [Cupriavidus taiwanensis]SOZ74394.1 protein of unknown function [Cupriavidus taiwanensis]SPA03301.1 protein of unknown function [Cupriavidus taiwanensis]SPA11275.1 protein of unknown function [Cupriavidus taiwanensis]
MSTWHPRWLICWTQADGRILNEALTGTGKLVYPCDQARNHCSTALAPALNFELPTDPTGNTKDLALTQGTYSIELAVKELIVDGKTYRYFDYAKAFRR